MGQKGRNRLKEGPWHERRAGAAARRVRTGALPRAAAEQALARGADRWDAKSPASSPRGRAAWER
jgi:hypothetical protein